MTERIPKGVFIAVLALCLPALAYLAGIRPRYFTSPTYLGGLLVLEFLLLALCLYRRIFFPLVILVFLCAGTNLGIGGIWIAVRWFFLCAGALVGAFIMLKERRQHFGLFHALAVFAVLAAVVSAAVSRYPNFALLKAISLLALFAYAGTGARLAVTGHEGRFFNGLITGCELFVGGIAACYIVGFEAMGNPNSLGAVMGVVGAPVLLWGTLLNENLFVLQRRQVLTVVAMYMTFHSRSRAGLAAAFISCALLCLALRRYKLLGQGIIIIVIIVAGSAIFDPEAFSTTVSSFTSSVVYKGKDPGLGVFASRQTPWQGALQTIHNHLWFGSGFGTTDNGEDASAHLGEYAGYATSEKITRENGSSYLTIATWVGMLGVLPFLFLLLVLLGKILRTILWMLNTGNACHPAIPLAMVLVAGLVHAAFEDWLFAVGYYLCVFFWSLAFILVDVAPYAPLPRFSLKWRPKQVQPNWGRVAPSR
ncbi:MAG TPA: O-antigen ligase family protein [Candidatus Sulfotelmatobacter sp.]|nr:O-antigen ligase family protein [Candidatus Sulfotelmatobacter sp.]